MRVYDCMHRNVNSLEKELLFKEVLRLRNLIVKAEDYIDKFIQITEEENSLKNEAQKFLNEGIC